MSSLPGRTILVWNSGDSVVVRHPLHIDLALQPGLLLLLLVLVPEPSVPPPQQAEMLVHLPVSGGGGQGRGELALLWRSRRLPVQDGRHGHHVAVGELLGLGREPHSRRGGQLPRVVAVVVMVVLVVGTLLHLDGMMRHVELMLDVDVLLRRLWRRGRGRRGQRPTHQVPMHEGVQLWRLGEHRHGGCGGRRRLRGQPGLRTQVTQGGQLGLPRQPVLLAALLAHAQYLTHAQHHVLHVSHLRVVVVRGITRRSAEDSSSGAVAVVVMVGVTPQDELLDVALLAEELVPRQSRGDHVRHIGGEAVTPRPARHRLRDPLGGVVLEAQVVGGQLLLGLLGGEGELLAVQQVHVAPQRALLGGGGGATLPIEVLIVLQHR